MTFTTLDFKTYFITLDFETYYDQKYTLKKLPTSLYVQDKQFEALSVALKTPDMDEARFVGGPRQVAALFDKLRPLQDRIVLCCHHSQFDAYIAAFHYDFRPRMHICTLTMARQLYGVYGPISLDALSKRLKLTQPKLEMPDIKGKHWSDLNKEERAALEVYNKADVHATEELALMMLEQFPRFELDIVDLTVRMFTEPRLRINAPKAKKIVKDEVALKKEVAEAIGVEQDVLRSNDKFAELLQEWGYEVPMKWSEKQEKMVPAFAQADLPFQALRDSDDPELAAIINARLVNKTSINESRAKGMLARKDHPVPIYLNAYGAHTMRWSGGDFFNPQNLPREGRLRECLEAPDGHTLVIVDAAQIEARDNATFSEQWDLVEAFRQGRDVYAEFASGLYGFEVNKEDHWLERFVGKVSILGLGYQMGAAKFQMTLEQGMMGPPVLIDFTKAQDTVNKYRAKYSRIKQSWHELQARLAFLMESCNREEEFRGLIIRPGGEVLFPNGLCMRYPNVGYEIGRFDSAEFYYKPYDAKYKKIVTTKIYGGSWLENCIAADTEVLTENGWKPIQEVRLGERVHDGVEFVAHDGVVSKGTQECIEIDGVRMTPDHEVLTDEGWKEASQNPRPYRPKIRLPSDNSTGSKRRKETKLARPVHMRERGASGRGRLNSRHKERKDSELRVQDRRSATQAHKARNVPPSSVRSVPFHDRSLQAIFTSGVGKLRSARDMCVREMAAGIRALLGGYGEYVSAWINSGSHRQQQGVLSAELPVGGLHYSSGEPKDFIESRHSQGVKNVRRRPDDALLPLESRAVYDILNAGPRQRFVVRGSEGPFVVHNCIQCRARSMTAEHALTLSRHYRVVLTAHDEIIMCVPNRKAERCLRDAYEVMSTPPRWNEKCPLAAEGTISKHYVKPD